MLTDARLQRMSPAEIEKILYESVFRASILFERLQACNMISGDGYTLRKELSKSAVKVLKSNWNTKDE
jgi:hypothetical protein